MNKNWVIVASIIAIVSITVPLGWILTQDYSPPENENTNNPSVANNSTNIEPEPPVEPEPEQTFTVTILRGNGGYSYPRSGTYVQKVDVSFSAEASAFEDYNFLYWLRDGEIASTNRTITIIGYSNESYVIQPVFEYDAGEPEDPEPEDPGTPEITPEPKYSLAIDKAIKWLEETDEPYALLFLDVIYRRFGIEEFADASQRYDVQIVDSPVLRVFRRIVDYDNQLQPRDLEALDFNGDVLTAPALYCDRIPLPTNYPLILEGAMNSGRYMLTHSLLAWIWIQENGCELALPEGFVEEMFQANSNLINLDSLADDIELEAAVFLYLAGQGEFVDDTFIQCVINNQDDDGSWEGEPERWHSTVLGLTLLLHVEYPADTYQPMLAPKPS